MRNEDFYTKLAELLTDHGQSSNRIEAKRLMHKALWKGVCTAKETYLVDTILAEWRA